MQADIYSPITGTKQTIVLGAHNGILAHMEELVEGSSSDIVEVHSHFLQIEEERKMYYNSLERTLNRISKDKRFDKNTFVRDMENIVKDILVIGDLQLTGDSEEVYAPLIDPTSTSEDAYIGVRSALQTLTRVLKQEKMETQQMLELLLKKITAYEE
jgi:hypothetical protein